MEMIVYSGAGMGNSKHIKEGGLFDFVICIKIGFQAWENPFFNGCEKLCVIKGRVEDNFGIKNLFPFRWSVVKKIGFHAKGQDL